ncbi:MAG: septum site-determining protein MinD [Ruminococcaceae bacterium]|nr:septum site-determining protein MinD [Oscillospiraceae bacterium]
MARCKIIMITSCKGGVGKSTFAANLSMTLALMGKKTMVIDCDFGMRSLDLIMGLESNIIYDICDVVNRDIPFEKALVRDERSEKLFFCASPYRYEEKMDPEKFKSYIEDAASSLGFDYVIIDTPGGFGEPIDLACTVANQAIILTTYQPSPMRAAERTGMALEERGISNKRLVINFFDEGRVKKNIQPGVIDTIDKTRIQLLGIVPEDHTVAEAQGRGALVDSFGKTNTVRAYLNIAQRLDGFSVPLLSGFKKTDRKILLK